MSAHMFVSRNSCLSCIAVNLSNRNPQSDCQITQWMWAYLMLLERPWWLKLESVQTIILWQFRTLAKFRPFPQIPIDKFCRQDQTYTKHFFGNPLPKVPLWSLTKPPAAALPNLSTAPSVLIISRTRKGRFPTNQFLDRLVTPLGRVHCEIPFGCLGQNVMAGEIFSIQWIIRS